MRLAIIAIVCFLVGATAALIVRSALHDPYAADAAAPAAPAKSPPHDHATVPPTGATPVNTICAVCGMEVDASHGTVEYHGKRIGVGCPACLPELRTRIDTFGPAALENRKASP